MITKKQIRRREFLRGMLAAGVGSAGLLGSLGTLSRAQAATQLAGGDDFRALVTVFLFGGNDAFNMIIPTDHRFDAYAAARRNLAVSQSSLLPMAGSGLGLHPNMPGLSALYGQNRVAAALNVGALVEPTTRADYQTGRAKLPPQLFSHEHQQVHWQTATPTSLVNQGWLGRAADLMETAYPQQDLPFNVSLIGSNTLQIGANSVGYGAGPAGPIGLDIRGEDQPSARLHDAILNRSYDHPLLAENARIRRRSIQTYERFQAAFDPPPQINTVFPETDLGQQLLGVARFLATRGPLGIRRQSFFVGAGGFDTHAAQAQNHPQLLAGIDQALSAFYQATVELGIADQVTLCTLSEFGRTLSINGDGTDHGWGSHQLVVGGAVKGGTYGQFPSLAIEGPDDAEEGRLIPTTALDEFYAPLVRWFGVPEHDLDLVLPNLSRFDNRNLGFL